MGILKHHLVALQEQSQASLDSKLALKWLRKKYNSKTEKKFQNSKGKCCANTQVKKFVASQDDEIEGLFGKKMSLVHVYFKDLEVTKFSKQENFGIMDLIGIILANDISQIYYIIFSTVTVISLRLNVYTLLFSAAFGGVVGLCMGFSFLSLAELIYFFTLRWLFDGRKAKSNVSPMH